MKCTALKLMPAALLAVVALQGRVLGQGWEVDLAGEWRFCTGDDARWAEPSYDDSEWEDARAPALWDAQGYQDYDGFGWYRKRFLVPGEIKARQFVFEHGGVDDDDWVYVNGTKVGEGRGCYEPRAYVIPPGVIKPGEENLIAIRIYDGAMGGGLAMGPIKVRERTLGDRVETAVLELRGGYAEGALSLHLEVVNKENVPHRLTGSCRIVDHFGRTLAADELDFALEPGGLIRKDIPFPMGDRTEYRVRLVLGEGEETTELVRRLTADARTAARGVLNLSGEWELLAPAGDRLTFPPAGEWQKAQVPTRGWGGWGGEDHRAWFRKLVVLPDDFKGRRVKLRFEAVAHHAQVYVNGRKMAEHLGGYEPFEVDMTPAAMWDEPNEIMVGVTDWVAGLVEGIKSPPDARRMPDDSMLIPYGTRPDTHKGIWDDVYVIAHGDVVIGDVFPMTSVRQKNIRLQVALRNEGADQQALTLESAVFDGEEEAFSLPSESLALAPGEERTLELERDWQAPRLWWPYDPHLYRLRTRVVANGRTLDEVNTRFGFRECWIDGIDYRLNGVIFKLRGLICPPTGASRDEIRKYYLRAKESNFSLVRFHMQPRSRYYYDIADEVGMCVKDESAFYCAARTYALADDRLWTNLAAHVSGMVLRSRSHPSLCIWSVQNEILHCGGIRVKEAGARIFELGRIIAALDPTRPIEYEGDGDVEGRAQTVNIHYPREFGCHKHNLWPNDAYWLGEEGNDRWPQDLVWQKDKPLIMGEFCYYPYSRPPGGVSVFTGDDAYRSKEQELSAHVQGVKFLCDACRRMGVAGLNPWVGDWRYSIECLKPIAVTFKEYDAHFFAGETVIRDLAVHNDTLKRRPLTLVCSVSLGAETLERQQFEFELGPGGMREVPFSWTMPDVSRRQELSLDVRLLAGGETQCHEERRFSVFPRRPPAVPQGLRIALYDPVGETARTLQSVGLPFTTMTDLSGLSLSACDLLLIGKDAASSQDFRAHAATIGSFVSDGGKVFCFEQSSHPNWLPVELRVDGRHAATIAFVRSAFHPLLGRLGADDLKFWRGDHLVSQANFIKPRVGAFRILADAGGLGGLQWSPLVEIPHGKGFYIVSQLLLTEKLMTEPVASRLLGNMLNYVASHRPQPPVRAALIAGRDAALKEGLAGVGVACDDVSGDFAEADLSPYGLLIIGRDEPALADASKLRQFASAGGTVLIHCPTAESEAHLKALSPAVKAVRQCRVKGRLTKRRDDRLMEGLSNSDFFWYREDCWYANWEGRGSGLIQNPANWQIEVEEGAGIVFTRPAALVSIPHDQGAFVISTIRWDDADPAVAEKASRIGSTLLFNLGAPFEHNAIR